MTTPDLYHNHHRQNINPIEDRLNNAKESYYEAYPDISDSNVFANFEQGEAQYVSIPPDQIRESKVWAIIIKHYLEEPDLLPQHALDAHPADSKLALETLQQSLYEGNVVTSIKECTDKERAKEATRLILTTREPVEREIPRYLHLQMALELAEQIKTNRTTSENTLKNIRKLAQSSPGFATILTCQLANLGPITDNLDIKLYDVFNIVPDLTPNREADKRMVHSIYEILQRGNIFSKLQNERAIELLLEKYPEEASNLYKNSTFKEQIRPHIVFESSFNILQEIFKKYGIEFNRFSVEKIGKKLEETVTNRIVTAYVKHDTQLSLGPDHAMLTEKTISKFANPTTSYLPPQNP